MISGDKNRIVICHEVFGSFKAIGNQTDQWFVVPERWHWIHRCPPLGAWPGQIWQGSISEFWVDGQKHICRWHQWNWRQFGDDRYSEMHRGHNQRFRRWWNPVSGLRSSLIPGYTLDHSPPSIQCRTCLWTFQTRIPRDFQQRALLSGHPPKVR